MNGLQSADTGSLSTINGNHFLDGLYEPVADDPVVVPDDQFRPFEGVTVETEGELSESRDAVPVQNTVEPVLCDTAAVNTFQYMVGVGSAEVGLPEPAIERLNEPASLEQTHSDMQGFSSSNYSERCIPEQSHPLFEKFKNSFAFGKSFVLDRVENKNFFYRQGNRTFGNEEFYYGLSIPYTEDCTSRYDLTFDSVDLSDYWFSVRSSALYDNIIYGIRVMFFAVLPFYILVYNASTKSFFLAGQLIPAFAASMVTQNFGSQCVMTVMMFQVFLVNCVWGTIMLVIHLVDHSLTSWFTVFVFCFLVGLCGDLPSKRLIMVYGVLMMEFQWQAKPQNDYLFAVKFARDFFFAGLCAQFASFFPYPIFAFRLANQKMKILHNLYAVALGNAIKSFWAPVLIDAEIARKQIPYSKIRDQTDILKELLKSIPYEPVEFGLKNTFRYERLDSLSRIRWGLYSLSASSALHNEAKRTSLTTPLSNELKETQKVLQDRSLKLSTEMMRVIVALGSSLMPKEVRNIDFGPLADFCTSLEDQINVERDKTLMSKKFSANEANHLLRLFAFGTTLISIAQELVTIESWAVNFNPRRYPSQWSRMVSFFVGDFWRDFLTEFPKRVRLSTPRDVRLMKDSFRYSLGLLAAVGLTHGTAKQKNVYYFGFAILARIAQQTASETLQIGIMRICGLALGASFAYVNVSLTSSQLYGTIIMMAFGFTCCCFGQHPTYGQVGQYGVIITIAGIALARDSPEKLLNRISANVFAFTSYLIICLVVFPVDPIRVVSNFKTKCFKSASDFTQKLVVLGCCPVTKSREESKCFLANAEKVIAEQHANLQQAQLWRAKAAVEPTIRGDVFPDRAFSLLFLHMAEFVSLQEGLLNSMKSLHRPRSVQPSLMICELLELLRPFLIDAAKLIQRYFQLLIDSSEVPLEWSLEKTATTLWRVQLSLLSLKKLTGNIQQNFIAALLHQRGLNQTTRNQYTDSSLMEAALLGDHMDNFSFQGSFSQLINSFRSAILNSAIDREDLCVFETVVVNFTLLMSTMTNCLESVIEIHGYEQSRRL